MFSSRELGVMDYKQGAARLLGMQVDPYGYAREWKRAHGEKVIAHLPPDVPEEIIHASGALPFAVMETDLKISLAHVHLPSFTCSLLKGTLETALQNNLDFIDGMVIPYVCDSNSAFSQVWEANLPGLFNHTLWLPK